MIVRAITLFAAAFAATGLLIQPGVSQGRGGTPPPSGGTGAGSSTGTGTPTTGGTTPGNIGIPTNPGNTTTNPQPSGMPQPFPISGRVMLEDGTAPTESVTIERVCGGATHAEGYTDSKGYFFIELGSRNNGVLQDASEVGSGSMNPNRPTVGLGGSSGGRGLDGGESRFMNCELRAKMAGFRSQAVSLANRRAMDNPDIGTILMHRLGPSEGNTVSASSLEIPKDARKSFDKAQEAAKKGKLDDAVKSYSKAVELYQPYAAAWYELGKIQVAGGDAYTARGSFNEAVKADSKFVPAYAALAELGAQAKKWREVADVTDRALKLDVFDYPQVYFYSAVANYNLKNIDVAEKNVRQAERLDTRRKYPQIYYLQGLILALHQDYTAAAEKFRTYLKLEPNAEDAPTARKQLDQVEKISATAATPKQDQ